MRKSDLEELSFSVVIVVILIALIVLGGTALLFFGEGFIRPNVLNLRREANQQSQQYIETTRGVLFQHKRKYDDLGVDIVRLSDDESNAQVVTGMKARQESILDEMEEQALSIPASEVPKPVVDLLAEKGRWTQ